MVSMENPSTTNFCTTFFPINLGIKMDPNAIGFQHSGIFLHLGFFQCKIL